MEEQNKKDIGLIQKPKEIIFIGRSNVGKSSLLNRILNTNTLYTSRHPVF